MTVIEPPIEKVFERWRTEAAEPICKENVSMDISVKPGRFPYMRLLYLGGIHNAGDIYGNEAAITISFQVESFANGTKALSKAYEMDTKSHKSMVGMGFRRTYQDLVENQADSRIKRVVSRYSRVYTGYLLGEEIH